MAAMSLRYPNIAGAKSQAESLKLAETIREYLEAIPKKENDDGKREQGVSDGQCDT